MPADKATEIIVTTFAPCTLRGAKKNNGMYAKVFIAIYDSSWIASIFIDNYLLCSSWSTLAKCRYKRM